LHLSLDALTAKQIYEHCGCFLFILLALGLRWIAVVNIVNHVSGSVLRATQHSEDGTSKKSDIPAESQLN
jgi:hypothetical protein